MAKFPKVLVSKRLVSKLSGAHGWKMIVSYLFCFHQKFHFSICITCKIWLLMKTKKVPVSLLCSTQPDWISNVALDIWHIFIRFYRHHKRDTKIDIFDFNNFFFNLYLIIPRVFGFPAPVFRTFILAGFGTVFAIQWR